MIKIYTKIYQSILNYKKQLKNKLNKKNHNFNKVDTTNNQLWSIIIKVKLFYSIIIHFQHKTIMKNKNLEFNQIIRLYKLIKIF